MAWLPAAPDREYKISEDSAKAELQKLFDFYEIDFDGFDEATVKGIELLAGKTAKAIRLGTVEIVEKDDGPHVVQHLKNKDTLDYRPMRGKDKIRVDAAGDNWHGKLYFVLGLLSGLGEDAVLKLAPSDLRTAEVVAALFLLA
jgi:hypothetical protein